MTLLLVHPLSPVAILLDIFSMYQVPSTVKMTLKCRKTCIWDSSQPISVTSSTLWRTSYFAKYSSYLHSNLLRTCSCTHLSFTDYYPHLLYTHCLLLSSSIYIYTHCLLLSSSTYIYSQLHFQPAIWLTIII